MHRLPGQQSEQAIEWLRATGQTSGIMTGFDPDGWPAHVWLLHAMYQNEALTGLGTHDEAHRSAVDRGEVEADIVEDVDLDVVSTVTGVPIGYVTRPGDPWTRLRWREYLDRNDAPLHSPHDVPPSFRWFPTGSWPVSISPPPEGSLDEVTWSTLIDVLTDFDDGLQGCFAFYGSLSAQNFDSAEVWRGPVESLGGLVGSNLYEFTPSNIWAADRGWFVHTDYDLLATKVSGPRVLIDRLLSHPGIEGIFWERPS